MEPVVADRDADRDGLHLYRSRMIDDHWNEQDVARELRKSDEYRNRHQ